jgi:hypothetical protein
LPTSVYEKAGIVGNAGTEVKADFLNPGFLPSADHRCRPYPVVLEKAACPNLGTPPGFFHKLRFFLYLHCALDIENVIFLFTRKIDISSKTSVALTIG